jgi:RNA polymerase sigma factor (sigma-70 family)
MELPINEQDVTVTYDHDDDLVARFVSGDTRVQDEFCNKYYHLAYRAAYGVAEKLENGSVDVDDLAQEAMLLIMDATKRYDPRKIDQSSTNRATFAHYAGRYLQMRLENRLNTQYTAHIPQYVFAAMQNDDEEIGDKDIQRAIALSKMESLDEILETQEDVEAVQVGCEPQLSIEGIYENHRRRELVKRVLDEELTEMEAKVLRLRFGFDDDIEHPLKSIAAKLGYKSVQLASYKQNFAIKKLLRSTRHNQLADL